MGQVNEYFANELLKIAFNRDTYTPAYDRIDVALVTQIPTLNTDPADLVEPTVGGYARQHIPFNTANWTVTGFREVYNANAVLFPAATVYWGSIEGYALLTALSSNSGYAGSVIAVGRLVVPLKVTVGVQPNLAAGTLQFGIYD